MKNLADKSVVRELRADIEAAYKVIEAKYGITLSLGTITSDRDGTKFSASIKGVAGSAEEAGKREFLKLAVQCGLKVEDYGAEVPLQGKTYKITGLQINRRRATVLLIRLPDGKDFTGTPSQVNEALGRTTATAATSTEVPANFPQILALMESR
jgi:hypothetical protein